METGANGEETVLFFIDICFDGGRGGDWGVHKLSVSLSPGLAVALGVQQKVFRLPCSS